MENIRSNTSAVRANRFSSEFVFTIVSLITVIIIVQAFYAIVVRPRAEAMLQLQREQGRCRPHTTRRAAPST